MIFRAASFIVFLGVLLPGQAFSQPSHEVPLKSVGYLELRNVKADFGIYRGVRAIRITDIAPPETGDDDRLAMVKGTTFKDGTIEVTLSGNTAPDAPPAQRGFVGIAFRVADRSHFECFYIRPKNGRSDDQLQRNHSAQYISIPGFPWNRLRTETPGKYESYVDLVPSEWTKIKIQVSGQSARLYVNGAEQPTLIVNDLKQPVSMGGVALWVGPGTIAHFRSLKITP
jgi:hypothetical protein